MTAERPRDLLGRPLPADADPASAVPGITPIDDLSDEQVWATAMDYLGNGMPFHAHEVFEARWRTAPTADRQAWQACAQWAAAMTHAARGNDEGARRLDHRARALLSTAPHIPPCMDRSIMGQLLPPAH
ncbi:MAG: DUF309 domain-containing protein [Actinobacteria bacterium]|nr:DUF309 domain-containing protein [Actinomycetota bacterium]